MADEEQLRFLKQGVQEWNFWRWTNPETPIYLQGANLREVYLEGANLEEANLQEAHLQRAHLEGANLEKANLQRAHLEGTHLEGANLEGANLEGANLEGANLEGADLRRANLEMSYLWDSNFWNANLEEANFQGAFFGGVTLERTNLQRAIFDSTKLLRTNFRNADLRWASLENTQLQEADLRGAFLYGANLQHADLWGANLQYAKLQGVDLEGAHLQGANALAAVLLEANLQKANLGGSNFQKANLEGANLAWADLQAVKFQKANLRGANLEEANLQRASLQGADLSDCNLVKVDVRSTNLTGVTLTAACIPDWVTNSATELNNIICCYLFLKIDGNGNFIERRPHNGNFAPGEFVELYFVSLETIDVIFRGGIDWQAFIASFQQVQEEAQGKLAIQAIERKKYTFVVRLEAPSTFDKKEIEREIKARYKTKLQAIEAKAKRLLQTQEQLHAKDLEMLDFCRHAYRQQSISMEAITGLLAKDSAEVNSMTSIQQYNDFRGARDVGVAGRDYSGNVIYSHSNFVDASGSNIADSNIAGRNAGGTTYNNVPSADIERLKAEIQALWGEIAGDRPTENIMQQAAIVADIENNPTLRQRFIGMLQAAGTEAFKEAIDNPAVNVLVAAIEGWKAE